MKTLSEIFKIYKGKKAEEVFINTGLRYIQIGDLRNDDVVKYTNAAASNVLCNKDDILIAWDGANAGTVGYNLEGVIGSTLAKLTPKTKNIHSSYVGRFLQSKFNYLRENCTGATIPHLSRPVLESLQIPLPPLDVQQKIASILDAADTLRQKDKALLAKYDELTQALFLNMFGDPVNNQKQLKTRSFGSIFKSIRYGTSTPPIYTNNGIPFIRATNVKKGTVALKGMVYISEEEAGKIEKCRIKEGDLIVVRSGANTGDCCRIPKEYDGCYGGFDLIIEIEEPYSTFYNFLLNSESGKKILEPLTRRAGQPHLNSKQMTELELIFPDPSYQTQFAERIAFIEQQKAQVQASLEKSEELFNSLLQKAFNGELIES